MKGLQKICFLLLFTAACAGKYTNAVNFRPSEPLRVAVLPFYQVDHKGNIVEPDPNNLLDNVPLLSTKLEERPSALVQKDVQSALVQSGLDLVAPTIVDNLLSHNGYRPRRVIDYDKLLATSPKALCELLTCDAVLYGKVTEWGRSYYALQSISTVGIELKLVRAIDGKELFTASALDSDSRGITKGPTGIPSVVLEPIRGLDNEIITNLASQMVTQMLKPLRLENRPEFLNSSPPAILASSHDAFTGEIEKSLTVIALGSPKKRASFSIGRSIENIPMTEKENGHYVGEFHPLPTDQFAQEPVFVTIADEYGRVTKQRIGFGPVTLRRGSALAQR